MNQKAHGFTVIEVVLVLAIAGLIFLMAFVALPSLWASQRDTERRGMVSEFISTLKKYQTNNSRGALPTGTVSPAKPLNNFSGASANDTSWAGFINNYLKKEYVDPNSKAHKWSDSTNDNYLLVAQCGSSSLAVGNACTFTNKNNPSTTPALDKTTYVAIGAKCDGNYAIKSANGRSVAVFYILERGGRYCLDM